MVKLTEIRSVLLRKKITFIYEVLVHFIDFRIYINKNRKRMNPSKK